MEKLDENKYLLCCKNGVIDFKEKYFRPEFNILLQDFIIVSFTNIKYHLLNINYPQSTLLSNITIVQTFGVYYTKTYPIAHLSHINHYLHCSCTKNT